MADTNLLADKKIEQLTLEGTQMPDRALQLVKKTYVAINRIHRYAPLIALGASTYLVYKDQPVFAGILGLGCLSLIKQGVNKYSENKAEIETIVRRISHTRAVKNALPVIDETEYFKCDKAKKVYACSV
ncbi:MAG TPA: hypothetical protein VK158_05975 [Acidobacteriota bacterium]|nr:hypothetical protein [Acidobacteriota bacterium]